MKCCCGIDGTLGSFGKLYDGTTSRTATVGDYSEYWDAKDEADAHGRLKRGSPWGQDDEREIGQGVFVGGRDP